MAGCGQEMEKTNHESLIFQRISDPSIGTGTSKSLTFFWTISEASFHIKKRWGPWPVI